MHSQFYSSAHSRHEYNANRCEYESEQTELVISMKYIVSYFAAVNQRANRQRWQPPMRTTHTWLCFTFDGRKDRVKKTHTDQQKKYSYKRRVVIDSTVLHCEFLHSRDNWVKRRKSCFIFGVCDEMVRFAGNAEWNN